MACRPLDQIALSHRPDASVRVRPAMWGVLAIGLLTGLAGCGGGDGGDAGLPPCPEPAILGDAADVQLFRPTGHDITDLVTSARISGLSGQCVRVNARTLRTTVTIGMDLNRGPAATSRTVEIPYFVAVMDGPDILDKHVYPLRVTFPPNLDNISITTDPVDLVLPITLAKTGAAYRIMTGFQLNEDQLDLNRQRGTRPARP